MPQAMLGDAVAAYDVLTLFALADFTADGASLTVDLQGYSGVGALLVTVGTTSGTTPTLDISVQEGDLSNGSDAADIAADDLDGPNLTQLTGADDDTTTVFRVNLHRSKRYLTLDLDIGGTATPTFPLSILLYAPGKQNLT
jgi:hypothetical protein